MPNIDRSIKANNYIFKTNIHTFQHWLLHYVKFYFKNKNKYYIFAIIDMKKDIIARH